VLDFIFCAVCAASLFVTYYTCGIVLSLFWHTVLSLGHDHEPDDCEECARLDAATRPRVTSAQCPDCGCRPVYGGVCGYCRD
jgi:hypothetical protein